MRSNHPKGVLKTLGIKQHKPAKVRPVRAVGGKIEAHSDATGHRAGSNEPIHSPKIRKV
jgi:hypothetical protein